MLINVNDVKLCMLLVLRVDSDVQQMSRLNH